MDPDQVERIYQESNNYLSEFIKINWIVGFPAYAFGGYTFHIQVLVIVVRYFLSRNIDGAELTQRTALNLAFKLLVLTYTMTHTITLAESTDAAVCSNIPDYDFDPCSKGVSPKLMNRQLKVALKALIERLKESLLQEFEKLIRSKKKSRWGTAFCVIIIFAVVLEDLQTCIHIQADIDKHNPGTVVADDDQVQEACHRMEHEGIDWLIDLFHQSFRTHKKNDGSFDPLSDGFDSRSNPLDLAETILVDGIRTLMDTSSEYIMQKAHCHPGTDIRTFEGLNTSRIVCRFLTSFESDPQEA
ncbi:MAG: hypothetical protein M1827_000681 [Pycnora praestabilis]|nr:MAG: hypothetical protein M1827_000681 [Pycnora praestabilis]